MRMEVMNPYKSSPISRPSSPGKSSSCFSVRGFIALFIIGITVVSYVFHIQHTVGASGQKLLRNHPLHVSAGAEAGADRMDPNTGFANFVTDKFHDLENMAHLGGGYSSGSAASSVPAPDVDTIGNAKEKERKPKEVQEENSEIMKPVVATAADSNGHLNTGRIHSNKDRTAPSETVSGPIGHVIDIPKSNAKLLSSSSHMGKENEQGQERHRPLVIDMDKARLSAVAAPEVKAEATAATLQHQDTVKKAVVPVGAASVSSVVPAATAAVPPTSLTTATAASSVEHNEVPSIPDHIVPDQSASSSNSAEHSLEHNEVPSIPDHIVPDQSSRSSNSAEHSLEHNEVPSIPDHIVPDQSSRSSNSAEHSLEHNEVPSIPDHIVPDQSSRSSNSAEHSLEHNEVSSIPDSGKLPPADRSTVEQPPRSEAAPAAAAAAAHQSFHKSHEIKPVHGLLGGSGSGSSSSSKTSPSSSSSSSSMAHLPPTRATSSMSHQPPTSTGGSVDSIPPAAAAPAISHLPPTPGGGRASPVVSASSSSSSSGSSADKGNRGSSSRSTKRAAIVPGKQSPQHVPDFRTSSGADISQARSDGVAAAMAHESPLLHAADSSSSSSSSPKTTAAADMNTVSVETTETNSVAGSAASLPSAAALASSSTGTSTTTIVVSAAETAVKKINYCEGHVDPFKSKSVETFDPPAAASFEKVTEWKDQVQKMIQGISKQKVGGATLRENIKNEVKRMEILRFNMFCMYA